MKNIYKVGDKVPKAGKYKCKVCGIVIEYLEKHVEIGAEFAHCPLCKAGTENGPKGPHEDFWEFVE